MKFMDRLEKIFGEIRIIEGTLNESALLFLQNKKERKADKIAEMAAKGDLVALFFSSLLIDFFKEAYPICKDTKYNVYVFEEGNEKSINGFGESVAKKVVKNEVNENLKVPKIFSDKNYELLLGNDKFFSSIFGAENNIYVSLASVINANVDGKNFVWKKKDGYFSSNPLIAIAQASLIYGDVFFLEKDGIFYQNPEINVDEFQLKKILENSRNSYRFEDLVNDFVISTILELKDAFAYYMSVEGKPIELYKKRLIEKSFFNKEVIVDKSLLHESWKEGVDYIKIDDVYVTTLSTLLMSFNLSQVFLAIHENAENLKSLEDKKIRKANLKKTHFTDIEVSYQQSEKDKDKITVAYKIGVWDKKFFPLYIEETYSVSFVDENMIFMVEI